MPEHTAATILIERLSKFEDLISDFRTSSEESRRRLHEKVELTNIAVVRMEGRVSSLERALNDISPTVKEFADARAKVQGAGMLGRWLWWLGGIVLAAAAGAATAWGWIADHFTLK